MKKTVVIAFVLFLTVQAQSQNLIRNGSFEQTTIPCVRYLNGIHDGFVTHWYCNGNTPDLYNSCYYQYPFGGNIGTPKNGCGYQPTKTGENYAGIVIAPWDTMKNIVFPAYFYNEIISHELEFPLDSNVEYNFSLHISPAGHWANFFVKGFGACFTSDSIIVDTIINAGPVNFAGHLISSNLADISFAPYGFLTDSVNWIKLEGSFSAKGDERFVHIGILDSIFYRSNCMFDSTNQAFMNYFDPASYYFIDDVALWRAGDSVYVSGDIGQADTTICYGDSVLLGGHHLPETWYRWQHISHGPLNYFSKPYYDSGFVWVKPLRTTSYILETTNCIYEKTYDTVLIKVKKCGPNAGLDTVICPGTTIVLGDSSNLGYSCQWSPSNYLSSDTVPMPVFYSTTNHITWYYLTVRNQANQIIKQDSVRVRVGACFSQVEVRDDSTICRGDYMQLGKYIYPGAQYEWSPNYKLNNSSVAVPTARPDTSTLYTLKLTDVAGNVSYDSVLVTVIQCPSNIGEQEQESWAKIYPNPCSAYLNIETKLRGLMHLELYDISGRLIMQKPIQAPFTQLKLNGLQQGVYILNLYNLEEQKRSSEKIIVF